MQFGFKLIQYCFQLINTFHLFLSELFILLLSLGLFWCASQCQSFLFIDLSLLLDLSFYLIIGLFQSLDTDIKSIHVLVDKCVLVLLFQKGLCDLFKLLDTALLFYFLKVLVNCVHVLLIMFNNLYLLLVLSNNIFQSQFQQWLSINSLCLYGGLVTRFSSLLLSSHVKCSLNHSYLHLMIFQLCLV